MLSQRSGPDQKMHPCAFFSRRLNPAERNYDVGNRQLLAVKLALEKWRHWLEGTEQPFIVWKDHKNHAYIQTAKRLNSHQARWALFFVRFNFTLTYRPGSRNMKPDTLSRMHHSPADAPDPDTILPPSGVLVAISWEIKSVIREAQRTHPDPGNPNRLFVTDPVRSQVLQWVHSSRFACHPGYWRTLSLLKSVSGGPIWRPTHRIVSACTVCPLGKSSHRLADPGLT